MKMADKTAHVEKAERHFIEREQALTRERRYMELQDCPDCKRARRRLKELSQNKNG